VLILAFDTSGMHGSVAVLDGPRIMAEQSLSTDRRSAQTLATAIVEILTSQRIEPRQIKLVATTIGPGSFTGLRVGVTAAKTFAYAAAAEVIAVGTLDAIGHAVSLSPDATGPTEIHAVLDAQRKELFVGRFSDAPTASIAGQLPLRTRLAPDCIVKVDEWLGSLKPGMVVAGSGVNLLKDRLPSDVNFDAAAREPRAAIVGQLAFRDYQAGRRDDLWKLAPVYLRPSYAEEKAARKTPPTSA
jgi:tRNA threonylcarbamoyladenosine biosynthesis protein TsaB